MKAFFVRLIRCAGWSVVTLVTVYALVCAYVNWTGSRHWAATKARLSQDGETIEFSDLLPPSSDRATNFCAIEALDGIALDGDETTPQGRKRQALMDLGWMKKVSTVPFKTGGRIMGKKPDLKAWAKFARDTGFVKMPPESGNDGCDLLQAIDATQPLVKTLADAAITHPNASITPPMRDRQMPELLVTLPVQYLNPFGNAQKALVLRALAASGCGDAGAATASLLATYHLVDAESQEPILINLLVAMNSEAFADEGLWSLLESRAANESELHILQTSLENLRFDHRALRALRGEMAVGMNAITSIQKRASDPIALGLMAEMNSGTKVNGWAFFANLIPSGLYDENKVSLTHLEYDSLLQPLKTGSYATVARAAQEIDKEIESHQRAFRPSSFLSDLLAPAVSGILSRVYWTEATRRQAVIACALERFYLQHKTYPEALQELTPSLLKSVPQDPIDDKPMRYRRTSDGRYMLWSLGFDQKDDDGKVTFDSATGTAKIAKREYKGDWTWQYQPVK